MVVVEKNNVPNTFGQGKNLEIKQEGTLKPLLLWPLLENRE